MAHDEFTPEERAYIKRQIRAGLSQENALKQRQRILGPLFLIGGPIAMLIAVLTIKPLTGLGINPLTPAIILIGGVVFVTGLYGTYKGYMSR